MKKKKTAVIIKGNPDHITKSNASHLENSFYTELKKIVESEGYSVSFDPGLPYTQPKDADVWLGFSRGADRLRFAPSGTLTIPVGSHTPKAINHPVDAAWQRKHKNLDMSKIAPKDRPPIPKEHLMITSSMERQLRKRLRGKKFH